MCCKSSQKVFYFICEALATYEGVKVDNEKEHQERILLNEYKSKLKAEGELIRDPLDLMNG